MPNETTKHCPECGLPYDECNRIALEKHGLEANEEEISTTPMSLMQMELIEVLKEIRDCDKLGIHANWKETCNAQKVKAIDVLEKWGLA